MRRAWRVRSTFKSSAILLLSLSCSFLAVLIVSVDFDGAVEAFGGGHTAARRNQIAALNVRRRMTEG